MEGPAIPNRIEDPTKEVCPDFASVAFAAIRLLLVQAGKTQEEAERTLREGWEADHANRVNVWQAQVQADLAQAEAEQQRLRDAEHAQREEEQRAAEEERKAMDKKKPKLARIAEDMAPPDVLRDHVSEYARDKLAKFAFVELDYFTADVKREASTHTKSAFDDTFTIVQSDSGINLAPASAYKAQKVRADANLPFAEFVLTWPSLVAELESIPAWPKAYVDQYSFFFLSIVTHRDNQDPVAQQALMLYVDEVRHEWHNRLLAKSPDDVVFNISIFSESLYRRCVQKVEGKRHKEAVDS
ncbi:hypothetical protein EVJ58_g8487, partial [Rhodofomes roseus]